MSIRNHMAFYRKLCRTVQHGSIEPASDMHQTLEGCREDIAELPENLLKHALVDALRALKQGYTLQPGGCIAETLKKCSAQVVPFPYTKNVEAPLCHQPIGFQEIWLQRVREDPDLSYLALEKEYYEEQLSDVVEREVSKKPIIKAARKLGLTDLPLVDSLSMPRSGTVEHAWDKWEAPLKVFARFDHELPDNLHPEERLRIRLATVDELRQEPHGLLAKDLEDRGLEALSERYPQAWPQDYDNFDR